MKVSLVCETCRKTYDLWPSRARSRAGRFCSRACIRSAPTPMADCICRTCEKPFQREACIVARVGAPYCSQACRRRTGRPLEERFWENVQKTAGCWLWTGSLDAHGYGQLYRTMYKSEKAHRLSYKMHVGPVDSCIGVLHSCDTPACVRPDHLFLGTQADNVADMDRKGRRVAAGPLGTASSFAKLTDDAVRAIRADKRTAKAIAADLGVHFSTIHLIKQGRTWRHVA